METKQEIMTQEIMEEILSMLPVKPLMKFKTVCKSWNSLISESGFSKLHLKRSIDANRTSTVYFNNYNTTLAYEASTGKLIKSESEEVEVSMLAHCNGLLCVGLNGDLLLWNPSIKRTREIPTSPVEFPMSPTSTWALVFFGLGHCSASDDYRLVRISLFHNMDSRIDVKIYSTNADAWRSVGDFPYNYPLARPAVFASNCLHWIVSSRDSAASHHQHMIAILDLADDSYRRISMPFMEHRLTWFVDIGALDGKLVVFLPSHYENDSSTIWILEEHDKEESWTMIKIATAGVNEWEAYYFQPLWFLKSGRILVRLGAKTVAIFDATGKRHCDVHVPHMLECQMLGFVESLVSPGLTSHPMLQDVMTVVHDLDICQYMIKDLT